LLAKQRQVSVVEAAVRRRTRELADVNAALRREGDLRAEGDRKLSAAQSINQRIFETSVDLILVVDRKGAFIQVSPSAFTILGYRPEEMEGRNGIEFLFAGDLDATRNEMREGRRSGTPRSFQCRYLHKDGRVVTLAWTGIWSGPEQQHFFIGRDMTMKQAMEQQLRQSQKLEAVGQLTGGIAHDFNNLLGVIIGNLDLVMDPSDPKRQESPHLKSALDAAMRGAELVRRLMVFSRRQPLSPSVFAVNDAIAEFEALLRRALGEATELQTQFGEAAGRIAADRYQFENALMNLCVNARDAMPSGGIIRVETASVAVDEASAPLYPDIAPGNYVTISVTDSGTGIAPEHLPKVFEPFFTTKTEGKGTGLGLAMVYGFMRESNGTAKIYSELGHGTTVRLYFPRTEAELSAEDDDTAATILPTGDETVLVVEDRMDMRAIAVAVLERLGYRALEADTAAAALAVLNSGAKIDFVFSDIVMPGGMSGLDLAQEIRNRGVRAPILLTSGYASPQALREQAQKLGIPVLGKPYRVADLAAKVRAMLDGRNGNGNGGRNGSNGKK
jgi:PAS domain S-box-containing protein